MGSNVSSTIDILKALSKDINNPKFNRYLFLTYSLDDEALEFFPKTNEVMRAIIYFNPEAYRKPKTSESKVIEIETLRNHAKIYCLWGPTDIKCWIGSFNFTIGGLSNNIEWAASFEGELLHPLEIEDIIRNKIRGSVSSDETINQIIDFVLSAINREDPINSDRVFQNKTKGKVLLHNLSTNTLQKCIMRIAEKAEKDLTITYITPFVNKGGIKNFINLFQHKFDLKNLCLCILTNLPNPDYPGPFINSETIQDCKRKFKDFRMLKRKKGREGIFRKDETEIGLYFIHMKLIHISFLNMEGIRENHTIFTSVNLTEEAWGKSVSRNLEIGIWVRDKLDNDTINSFLEDFKAFFSEPDKQELDEIDDAFAISESKRWFEEFWIENIIRERLSFKEDELRLDWNDFLPTLQNIQFMFCFRNIISSESIFENVIPRKEGNIFICSFKMLTEKKNIILERIKLTFDTDLEPPLIGIKKHAIPAFTKWEGDKQYIIFQQDLPIDWTELIVNNQKSLLPTSQKIEFSIVEAIDSLLFMKRAKKLSRTPIFIEVQKQTHFSKNFFKTQAINIVNIENLGKVFEVLFETDDHVDPPFDTIKFQMKDQHFIDPVAVSKSKGRCIYYFRVEDLSGLELTAMTISPYNQYFQNIETQLKFPVCSKGSRIPSPWENAFNYKIAGLGPIQYPLEKLLSPYVNIEVFVDNNLVHSLPYSIKYFYKEDALTYRQPLLHNVNVPITGNEPYSKMLCWGVLETIIDGKTIHILGSPFSYTIKDTAIVDFKIEEQIPISLSIYKTGTNRLKKMLNPIGWIIIDFEKIKFSEGYKIQPTMLELYAWKNLKRIEEIKLSILTHGKKWLLPISQNDLDEKLEYLLILEIKDTRFIDFSANYKTRSYRLIQIRSGLKFRRESPNPCDFPIRNNPLATIHRVELVGFSQSRFDTLNEDQRRLFEVQNKSFLTNLSKGRDILVCFAS